MSFSFWPVRCIGDGRIGGCDIEDLAEGTSLSIGGTRAGGRRYCKSEC